jgi:hypothetical protein
MNPRKSFSPQHYAATVKPGRRPAATPAHLKGVAQPKSAALIHQSPRPAAPRTTPEPLRKNNARPAAVQPKTISPPPVYRPQPAPKVLQTKAACCRPPRAVAHTPRAPVAPPVYRPEPKKIVQPKMATATRTPREAPPVYRPQPTPKVLQTKEPAGQRPLVGRRTAFGRQPCAVQAKRPPSAPPVYRPDNSLPVQLKPALTAARSWARPTPGPSQVIQPILKVGTDRFTSGTELRDWNGYRALKRKVNREHHNGDSIMRTLRAWARSRNKHKHGDWDEAVTAANLKLRSRMKKKRKHSPEPTSPLRQPERDLFDIVEERVDESRKRQKRDDWVPTETQLQGFIGECSHQLTLQNSDIEYIDANALSMNMPGIDAVTTGEDKCFAQSKMHLCSRDTDIYLNHVDRRGEYSKKLVKRMVGKTPSSVKARSGLREFAKEKDNDDLLEIMKETKRSVGEGVEDLVSYNDDTGLVNMVANQIYFPVPSDIYDQIPDDRLEHFSPLDYDMRALNKVKAQFGFRPTEERKKKTEEDKDPTFRG